VNYDCNVLNFMLALPERASKIREMQILLHKLPVPNLETLKFLFSHLRRWVHSFLQYFCHLITSF